MDPGNLVRCRNRDWVLLPSERDDVLFLRPLAGAVDEVVSIHRGLTDLIGYDLPEERVRPSTFPLPTPSDVSDAASAHLLWQARRATFGWSTRTPATVRSSARQRTPSSPRRSRRVSVLWREAQDGRPEANPWRLSFSRMFDMSNDSYHFRTAPELAADGYRHEGNLFVSPYDRYLPLYEAKMLHQFDHRFSTYEGATEKQLNVGILPKPSAEQKRDPSFVVQPRYWVREELVESTIPRYPEALAVAVSLQHRPSIERVLTAWAAGYRLLRGAKDITQRLFDAALPLVLERGVAKAFGGVTEHDHALALARDFPLTETDVRRIEVKLESPEALAMDPIERFRISNRRSGSHANASRGVGKWRSSATSSIYDAMQAAPRSGQSYGSRLDPPPGEPHRRHVEAAS